MRKLRKRITRSHPPLVRSVALILLPTFLAGCQKWVPTPVTPKAVVEESQPESLRLTLRDETRLVVKRPTIIGDSLVYEGKLISQGGRPERMAISLDEIGIVETREIDKARTYFWSFYIGITVVAAVACAITCKGFRGLQ